MLVGNKCDLASEEEVPQVNGTTSPAEYTGLSKKKPRAISKSEAESYCSTHNIIRYVETSAKSGEGVEAAFLEVAQRIYENIEKGKYDLNDRRSGVKGHGAGGAGQNRQAPGAVRLGMNDVTRGRTGAGGGCC